MRISDWSSDVCSSDLHGAWPQRQVRLADAAGADVAQQRVQLAAHGGSTFPGLRMPSGSNAAFTARIAASVGASNARAMKLRLATPMPCSPDSVPPSESVSANRDRKSTSLNSSH